MTLNVISTLFPGVDLANMNAVASNANFGFKKIGLNLLLHRHNASPFINTTIYNYLWNYSSPVLHSASKIPTMVPTLNAGILENVSSKLLRGNLN